VSSEGPALCEERLKTLNARTEQASQVLEMAIRLVRTCEVDYRKAEPATRRLFNQAFFDAVCFQDRELKRAQRTELFEALTTEGSNMSNLVGPDGFEPSTSRLSAVRSNQLSYGPR
jgi:hypothetical protein